MAGLRPAVAGLFSCQKGTSEMSNEANDLRVDYVEFPCADIEASKRFYNKVFGWQFTDYGPEYTSFGDGRLNGGFSTEREVAKSGPLVVIYARDIKAAEATVKANGGKIVKETFEFPGGRRFHFTDPSGNELAVWSE